MEVAEGYAEGDIAGSVYGAEGLRGGVLCDNGGGEGDGGEGGGV